jgi:hypothetical protein
MIVMVVMIIMGTDYYLTIIVTFVIKIDNYEYSIVLLLLPAAADCHH